MSLPRECHLQDSRESLYSTGELDTTGRIQHQSGGLIRLYNNAYPSASNGNSVAASAIAYAAPNSTDYIAAASELPIAASSQPPVPSILTECQQSSGSLFSIVSAPLLPLAEMNSKKAIMDTLNIGLQSGTKELGTQMGGSAQTPFVNTQSDVSIDMAVSAPSRTSTLMPKRPISLAICPTAAGAAAAASSATAAKTGRALHASLLLENQISEIEEDDNENLLTVSSITARPLIAKSRELRSNRHTSDAAFASSGKRFGKYQIGRKSAQRSDQQLNRTNSTAARKYNTESSRSSISSDPPDGGYGWLIVFGAFSVHFWVSGLVKSYGVLYVEIMETFPSSTATVASWIPAILSALCLALAPISSALCQRFSCRSVVFVGGLFCALGMTLSYFATSLVHLLFTFGILTGIGGGLSTTPGIVIVSQYFDKHRALANGICVSGTATGSFILPVLIKHLVEKFGFHGTILILGFCMFHVCISALLYRPLDGNHMTGKSSHETDETDDGDIEKRLNRLNASNMDMLTNSTYLETCDDRLDTKFIEHLFMEESKNRLNEYYNSKNSVTDKSIISNFNQDNDEIKDIIGETTFIKPIKKVRSSGIIHSVEDLSTNSTWVYRKASGSNSNRASRRKRNVFANDEIISKIQAHFEKPFSPPPTNAITRKHLTKSMEIPITNDPNNTTKADAIKLQHCDNVQNRSIILNDTIDLDDDDDDDLDDLVGKRSCYERIKTYLDISLLKDPIFILMSLSVTLMSVGCPHMLYFLPAHVVSIGYTKSEAGYLVTVSAVLDLVGRLGLGWLSDLQLFDQRKTYIICILGAGLAVLSIPMEYTIYLVGLSAAIYGICLGSWYVLMPVLLADIFGTDRISSSYGLIRMFQSIGAISVPPLAGYLRDLSGSYIIVFYCMGSCMVLGCLPLLIWIILETHERKIYNKRSNNCDTDTSVSVS